MIDLIATLFLLIILLYFEFRQQRLLLIRAKNSRLKLFLASIASASLIWLFWSPVLEKNIQSFIIAAIFFSVAFYHQGLGESKVITYGSVSNASDYERYDQVIIERIRQCTMLTFESKKGGSYSIIFDTAAEILESFLKKRLPKKTKLLHADEYMRLKELEERDKRNIEAKRLAAIRTRPSRNRFIRQNQRSKNRVE
ncbi:MAG: hypothetical protein ABF913_06985 [Oenococcus sp.]|uniref:hypothetical protein n=1 Tax=Oenococcus sp. TaxID=1979414 RepID=UPI0039EC2B2C